jgi:Flp pilus assembly protein TadG
MKYKNLHACFRRKSRSGGESGQALIEVALALPMLLALLLGAAEFARVAYASIEVTNAASAGVQYAAQNHTTALDTAGAQLAASNDASDVTSMTATLTHSCVCSDGTGSTCVSTDCSSSRIIESVQVITNAKVSPLLHYPGLPASVNLTGNATMRVQQ